MLHYDDQARRQLCRERANALARDYRRARPVSRHDSQLHERSRSLPSQTLSLLRRLRRRHAIAPAYRG
jgi:hypothetical protein